MLGVLKRRWKPKRSSNGGRLSVDACPTVNSNVECPVIGEKSRCVPVVPCARQVHPAGEDRTHMHLHAYDACDGSVDLHNQHNNHITSSYQYQQPNLPTYPLAPNICVEAGRIEFIKLPVDGTDEPSPPPPFTPMKYNGKVTVNRAQQTSDDESFHVVKGSLEARITELEEALEAAKITELRDKETLSKLQKQLSKKESTVRDVERERRLRTESETRVREAAADAARCRTRLKLLTHEFARMEETVKNMLVYKTRSEQLKQEKNALAIAFETRTKQYQTTIGRLNQEVSSLRQQLDTVSAFPTDVRLTALETENAALTRDADTTRRQYERCLDDIAHQVVRALLAQKNLREEITSLTRRIKDLETQNRALTTLLVHQLRGETNSSSLSPKTQLSFTLDQELVSSETQGNEIALETENTSCTMKKYNSFNSDVLRDNNNYGEFLSLSSESLSKREKREKHLSADADICDTRLSLEDKKRHHILTKLWTELNGVEVTPQKLLDALSMVDSSLWVPPKRPISLNLQLPVFQNIKCHRRSRILLAQPTSKSEEDTGNETPESGNRDEGYSTMSSDVQGEITRVSGEPARGLEDLKEATDETDFTETKIIVIEDQRDPDVLYIPLNFTLGVNPRNSFPPSKGILPFQHIMRSFSDSHLCLKITTAPSPCYSLSSPMSSSPSILLLDITDKSMNPLRRVKGTNLLPSVAYQDEELQEECGNEPTSLWEAEYVQQWIRLDESRSAMQKHQRELLELEYDRAELEDWSLSLSTEDLHHGSVWKQCDIPTTPGQISITGLPCIQENNAFELEEDSNECLWNSSSYMTDKVGEELVALLMDTTLNSRNEKQWPYAVNGSNQCITSPGGSWSSVDTNSEEFRTTFEPETYSKRSSATLSGCSDDTNDSHFQIGTDFTRDFYRLVKFESSKSLASVSSRSIAGCLPDHCDREQALQNVLTFIAEQQMYCKKDSATESAASSRPSSVHHEEVMIKDFNIESPPQLNNIEDGSDLNLSNSSSCDCDSFSVVNVNENYVNLKQLRDELKLNEQNNSNNKLNLQQIEIEDTTIVICDDSVIPIDDKPETNDSVNEVSVSSSTANMTESQTSTASANSETIVSRIPRRQIFRTSTPINNKSFPKSSPIHSKKIPQPIASSKSVIKSKIPSSKDRIIVQSKIAKQPSQIPPKPKDPPVSKSKSSCSVNSVIVGPPHRAVSFHERATSKDVIDELNRMIQKGEENIAPQETEAAEKNSKLDEACKRTGWIHVEKTVDLNDPKSRAMILDVMMTSSDSSPTSSCGGSVSSESTDDPSDYSHLHRIHRFNRQKKASAVRPQLAVLRCVTRTQRPCIIGRDEFYVRYGEKEREAVSSFDFLDDFSTGSLTSSIDEETTDLVQSLQDHAVDRVSS